MRTAIDTGQTFCASEYRFLCRDGSYAKVLDRGYIVMDEQKRPVRMVGALMQISKPVNVVIEDTQDSQPARHADA